MENSVIIVGAGPTGLMLAGELRLSGVAVTVLERLREPTGQSRGLGFTARAMEVLDQRGLLSRFDSVTTSTSGHFGGIELDYGVLEDGHFGVRGIPQARTEAVLEGWATELGAEVRRGCELVDLTDDGSGVDVDFEGPQGVERLRASYLVGCDGGRSTTRKKAGIDFPGSEPTLEMFLGDVRGMGLRSRFLGEKVTGGMVMAAPLEDDVDRIIVCERGVPPKQRTEPPDFSEVAAAWERLTGEDIHDATPLWVSAFSDAARQAAEYRKGRVLLAGDAAHVHLPAGGQGLSVGVQDAVNLGWKLAAVLNGWAPDGLLDTYHEERHAVGVRLLRNTRAQGLLYLSGEHMRPLRELFAELLEHGEVARYLAGMVSGLDITYEVGPGDHPLLGRRLPPRKLLTGSGVTSTAELLRSGKGLLLYGGGDAGIRESVSGWADRVDVVAAESAEDADRDFFTKDTDAVLVRPDGHVVWATPGEGELDAALRRWFGSPA